MRTWTRFVVMVTSLTVTSLLMYGCGGGGSGGSSTNTPFAPSVNKSAPAPIPATGDNGASVFNSIVNSTQSVAIATVFTFDDFVDWTNPSIPKAAPVAKMANRVAAVVKARKALPIVAKQVPKAVNLPLPELDEIFCPEGGKANANASGTGDNYSFSLNFVACQEDPTQSDGSYELLNGPMSISGTLNETTGLGTFTASESLTWTEYNNSTEKKVLERWSANFSMANGKFTVKPGPDSDPSKWLTLSAVTSGQYKDENLSAETPYTYIYGLQGLDVAIDQTSTPKTLTIKSGSIGSYYYENNVLQWYQTTTFDNLVLTSSSSGESIAGWIAFAVGGPAADAYLKSLNGTYHVETVTPKTSVLGKSVPDMVTTIGQYKLNGGTTTETLITYYSDGSVTVTVGSNAPIVYLTASDFDSVSSIYIFGR